MKLKDTLFQRTIDFFELSKMPYKKYNRITKFIPTFVLRLMWKFLRWDYWKMIHKYPELQKEQGEEIRKALN